MAKVMQNIPCLEPFIIDKSTSTNLDRKWLSYLEEFELFITASGLSEQNQKQHYCYILVERIYAKRTNSKGRYRHI